MKGTCGKCQQRFEYPWQKRRRRFCDDCKAEAGAQSKKVWSKANYHLGHEGKKVLKLRPQVAAMMGLPAGTIASIEAQVFEKIRRDHPELRALWQEWIRQGMPRPARSDGSELLDYQLEVSAWWETYERIVNEDHPLTPALSPAAGERVSESAKIPKAAAECLRQIQAFQRAVRRALDEFSGRTMAK